MTLNHHLALVNAAACTILALVAVFRRRQSVAQWAFAVGMLLLAGRSACDAWAERSTAIIETYHAQLWAHVLLGLTPAPWLLFSLAYSRGNAREFLRRWVWTLVFSVLAPAAILLWKAETVIIGLQRVEADGSVLLELGMAGVLLHGFVLISMIVITMNFERTFRASVGTMRWRIKYMLIGLAVLNSVQFYASSQAVLFHATSTDLHAVQAAALLIACLCIGRSFLRPGQFSIDLHPSHSALYGSITLILAGAYLVIVGVLARFVAFIGGDSAFPVRALVVFLGLVGLAIVLQSDRARMALRYFVSRHFRRPLFDYRTIWQRFANGMATGTDTRALSHSAVKLISSSFEIQSVCLWLANERRDALTLAASTLIDESVNAARQVDVPAMSAALAHFAAHPDPIDLEDADFPGAGQLRECHVSQFPHGGHRHAIPLVAQGSAIGIITLGDRVGGVPFALHDLELFRCIGDHIAASLQNVQFAQRLAQAREFEAFQSMATFFVHDLKNAANTLSLLLQNLPEHFQDPEFREDAMKSCGRTVDHINGLIEKLGTLRSGLTISPVRTDLNALVARVLEDWPKNCPVMLEYSLGELPPVSVDPDQVTKVVTNLVINAREATQAGGRVHVSTAAVGGQVSVTVTDTGCGMTEVFMRKALFRPFQTTKKRGLGIGMFQSKMIVEAHGGRIDVRSTPGVGSTFEVLLPLSRA